MYWTQDVNKQSVFVIFLDSNVLIHSVFFIKMGANANQKKKKKRFPFYLIFWLHCTACGILVPPTRDGAHAPAVEVQHLNHWTPGNSPDLLS